MAPRKPENERKVTTFRPFGRIASHVDPMVLYTFLGLLIISIVLLAFQLDNKQDCANTEILLSHKQHADSKTYIVGEVITFEAKDSVTHNSSYVWEFGDSSARQTGFQVRHAYMKAGSYVATLKSGKCSWTKEIIVVMGITDTPVSSGADIFPVITGPDEAFVGRKVTFTNNTPGATSWNWRLLQNNAETHSGSSVSYVFSSVGERILTLIVNGDTSHMVQNRVTVYPAIKESGGGGPIIADPWPGPPRADTPAAKPAEPPKPKVPAIADEEFLHLLKQVPLKQRNASDFAQFLCGNLDVRVLLNDKQTDNFSHFCARIHGKKRFKIEKVNLVKDPNGCVTEIRILYDKKVLGIF